MVFVFGISSCSDMDEFKVDICRYPDGKDFAFTITEDPDYSKMVDRNIVYNFIDKLGFKTTVAVWVLDNKHGSGKVGAATNTRGVTTNNTEYLKLLKKLKDNGFEICLHTAGPGNDLRDETIEGYEIFKKLFGEYPKMNINHANNLEDIYWGKERFSNRFFKWLYSFKGEDFKGHIEDSEYFWGDVCQKKIKYVRAWATDNINTLSVNKTMPYHLKDKPYVNWWFGCSDGYNREKFNSLVSDSNINKLVTERGTCIAYTHFAYGFVDEKGEINNLFKKQMEKISKLNGWFVPASTILDRFLQLRDVTVLKKKESTVIINSGSNTVKGLTIRVNVDKVFLLNSGEWKSANDQGEIVLGDLLPYAVIEVATSNKKNEFQSPGFLERVRIVFNWLIGR